jgi:prefoldin beta subunit
MSLPPQAQKLVAQLQQQQMLLERVRQQRELIEAEIKELQRVKETVKELPDDAEIYKNIGHVLVKTKKDEVLKEVEEKIELLEVKLNAQKKQEEMIIKEIEKLKAELQKYLGVGGVGGGGS